MRTRWATVADAQPIAKLWHRSWLLAHSTIVPAASLKQCTEESFAKRTHGSLFEQETASSPRITRPTALIGEVNSSMVGFVIIRGGSEIEHFYVDGAHHGTGAASQLLSAAETAMQEYGTTVAHLVVARRNLRAIKFYERHAYIATSRQSWMTAESGWQQVLTDESYRLTEDEIAATEMRCTAYKKFLGYEGNPNDGRHSYGKVRH